MKTEYPLVYEALSFATSPWEAEILLEEIVAAGVEIHNKWALNGAFIFNGVPSRSREYWYGLHRSLEEDYYKQKSRVSAAKR